MLKFTSYLLSTASFALACAGPPIAPAFDSTAGDVSADDAAVDVPVDTSLDAGSDGSSLFLRLAGLWSGPVTDTRLGMFPLTNMDFRPVSDGVLFGRVDLDAQNSLRFAFQIETTGGVEKVVFRNGGLFQGVARDTRMELVSVASNTFHFCAIDGGCGYADATFTFSSATHLELRVLVRGQLHELWNAERVEARELPSGFPVDRSTNPAADFPAMGAASVRVTWNMPVASAADVWVILSTTSCLPFGMCAYSRSIKITVPIGATSAVLRVDQLHRGSYRAVAFVDRNNNLSSTRWPDTSDLVSVPDAALTAIDSEVTLGLNANYVRP